MRSMRSMVWKLIAVTAATPGTAGTSSRLDANIAVRNEVETSLARLQEMLTDGSTGEQIAEFCCSSNLIIVAEGQPEPLRDRAQFALAMNEVLANIKPPCSLKLLDPLAVSETVAAGFVQMKCSASSAGQRDIAVRILYVWQKIAGKWLMTHEMDTQGTMHDSSR